jgi:hypothetical protein
MSETTTEQVQETVVDVPSPFAQDSWSTDLPTPPATTVTDTVTQEKALEAAVTTEVKTEEQKPTTNEWYKSFGWETEDAAKAEIPKLKENKPQEYKFENEESQRLAEAISKGDRKAVRQILETQERLDEYTTAEVNDSNAADIIKMGMQLKYKDLSPQEIEYKYNKEFGLPKEPTQNADELDEEFASRKEVWQEKVNDIKMNRNIEAKLAKPELEKLKSTIVLPEFNKPETQAATNQLSEVQLKEIRDNFLRALDSNYNKVEGFTTQVKDELVDYAVQFKIPDEAKVAIKGRLTEGLDVNDYMDRRWFDDKGTPKIEQIITDLYQLENLDKILSGVANKSASERWEVYQKSTKNLNVNTSSTPPPTFQQNGNGNVSPFAQNAWSEKPPLIQN